MLKEIIAVFVGGGIGSILRFLISRMSIINNSNFPFPTFISNILGCILLGFFLSYFIKNNSSESTFFIFLTVGVCGGFTTFSSFSNESLQLIQNGQNLTFLTYLLLSFATGLLGVYLGMIGHKLL
jgi:CrcB protein|tara:strand:- start:210 stop:584 length:375 start_codon:yes stop_codon:yes gene_type:complete